MALYMIYLTFYLDYIDAQQTGIGKLHHRMDTPMIYDIMTADIFFCVHITALKSLRFVIDRSQHFLSVITLVYN